MIGNMKGLSMKELNLEINKRKTVLDLMVKNNFRSNKLVSKIIESYYQDPDKLLVKLSEKSNSYKINNHD